MNIYSCTIASKNKIILPVFGGMKIEGDRQCFYDVGVWKEMFQHPALFLKPKQLCNIALSFLVLMKVCSLFRRMVLSLSENTPTLSYRYHSALKNKSFCVGNFPFIPK